MVYALGSALQGKICSRHGHGICASLLGASDFVAGKEAPGVRAQTAERVLACLSVLPRRSSLCIASLLPNLAFGTLTPPLRQAGRQ